MKVLIAIARRSYWLYLAMKVVKAICCIPWLITFFLLDLIACLIVGSAMLVGALCNVPKSIAARWRLHWEGKWWDSQSFTRKYWQSLHGKQVPTLVPRKRSRTDGEP